MFNEVFKTHKKVLIPFLMAGVPTLDETMLQAQALIDEGAHILEIGVPFSDPGADGPILQKASEIGLRGEVTLEKVLATIARIKQNNPNILIVLFTYLNPVLSLGTDRYVSLAREAGVNATLTVDLPVEEAHDYLKAHEKVGLKTVFLASPTTGPERIEAIKEYSSAFLYYVSRTGVTGLQKFSSNNLGSQVANLQRGNKRPTCVGFGISTPEDVAQVSRFFDGVIIGSAYMKMILEGNTQDERVLKIKKFTRECVRALQI